VRTAGALKSLYWQYALNAVGLVPHMLFAVDYIARGLGQGLAAGARYWLLLGAGAVFGPMILGRIADRTGFARAIRWAYLAEAAAIALVVAGTPVAMAVSSAVVGAFIPGVTALTLGRVRELAAGEAARQTEAWGFATAAFSVGQAAAGYGCAWIIKQRDDYALIFVLGAGALLLALAINLAFEGRAARRP
jgi:predicted MFS family arabinose efflux permease